MSSFDYQTLQQLSGGAAEIETTCPACSAGRKPFNRNKKVLKIWNKEPGFATYGCAHCGESGYARDDKTNGKSNGASRASEDAIAKALMAAIGKTPPPQQQVSRQSWIYKTEDGTPYLRVERVERNGQKSYPQSHWNGSGWDKGKPAGPKIPYRLPELVAAPGQPVFITEGEKCADAVAALGWLATSASEGATKWKPELNKWFADRVVFILPDNDKPGIAHADTVARNLHGIAREVRVVKLEELGDGEDVVDWIKRDPFPENLLRIAEDAPLWDPAKVPPSSENAEDSAAVGLDDFYAFMPMHNYIFAPTRDTWPGSSVNARVAPVLVGGGDKPMPASQWLDQNKPVEQMSWVPGEPMIIKGRFLADGGFIERTSITCFNLYRPPALKHGDPDKAGPWLEHVRLVYPDDAEHLIKWLAHRVQRPHEKINHALVLGGAQGIGKDTALEPVKRAIGPWNFSEVSPQQMLGRFNGYLKSVILRISEARDLGEFDRFKFYDHSKAYIAAPPDVLRVDEKNLREFSIPNVSGIIITTNHKTNGIFLPADDRRHYVAWSDLSRDSFEREYWNKLWRWYNAGGDGHVAAYLAQLDLSSFDAKAPPPKTQAFWEIVGASRAPEDDDMQDAIDALGNPDALTLSQVIAHAEPDFELFLRERKNARLIPHRLEACGYVAVRCDSTTDGRWKIGGRNVAVYSKATLSIRDRIAAARALAARER